MHGIKSGSKVLTADSAVGVSGKPCRIFSCTFLVGGGGGTLVLRNGTTDSDTVYVTQTGTASETYTLNFEEGLLFPDGCFYDKGSTSASVFVFTMEN